MYKKTTLKNGLRIITVPMKNTRTVTVLVLVGAGSKYETKNINGISHFLEHMFFKGTEKRPNKLTIAETLDRVGGIYNAFTGREYTGYFAKVDLKHFELAMDWVSDIFLNSKIEEQEIDKERGVILEEINMYLDTPMLYIEDLWEKLLYGNQPAGWLNIGRKKIVKKLKREQFLDYLKSHYTAKNTIVCLAGNINARTIKGKIQDYFKNIRTVSPKPKLKVVEKQTKPQSLVHFKKTDQTHLVLGARGYSLLHPKKYAQAILATILGGNMSSRLFMSVREEKGLAYYIRTSSENYTDTGYLATSAGIRNKKVEEAITLILKEYKAMKNKKINKAELQKAKDYLKGTLTLSLESSDAQASFYTGQELLTGKILTPEQEFKKIDEITENDILKVAKDIFQPEKLNLALIGPFKEKTKFEKILKI
ncbi:insulinase family protein [Candidatus Parcubacteria bacterium]|nr:insulinase family protein [Candidatus Parcubacteria bacterium]